MEPVTLRTDRLLLRPLCTQDAEALHAACQDPAIRRWTTVPDPYLPAHATSFVEQVAPGGWRDDTAYSLGVFDQDGTLVGTVGLVTLALDERRAEVGYWTAPEQRGRGYTVEAVRALAHWAFTTLGVERLEWYAEAGNEASRAVALKAGFTMEGLHRSRLLHRGTRRDAWGAALVPADYGLPTETPYLPAGAATAPTGS
ncbi:GNAT family N-acetyltransferase [Streptomyces durbertensis]|uniref:GNAT family N-acetyltransferase n=1 Tax=Streptomyces durbertensis TaxID=2448886 RepID=A0ABR6ELQ6_9ACTN|nr:GNAT family N-acetyltransferase [Streptomyces durbertensis]MBB1246276.1 GNAT family N-acetyltransferase [Streptomyces durbertensis]